jgi:hypothetical protein
VELVCAFVACIDLFASVMLLEIVFMSILMSIIVPSFGLTQYGKVLVVSMASVKVDGVSIVYIWDE